MPTMGKVLSNLFFICEVGLRPELRLIKAGELMVSDFRPIRHQNQSDEQPSSYAIDICYQSMTDVRLNLACLGDRMGTLGVTGMGLNLGTTFSISTKFGQLCIAAVSRCNNKSFGTNKIRNDHNNICCIKQLLLYFNLSLSCKALKSELLGSQIIKLFSNSASLPSRIITR